MRKFANPLDNIRVASPCSADWNEMYGSDRKRFCGHCKLNVYNLSDMTRQEAENLLLTSEGRLCVRFFRRADGTVLTKNCPVGWQAVKQRVSRVATAALSIFIGIFSGIIGIRVVDAAVSVLPTGSIPPVELPVEPLLEKAVPVVGDIYYQTEVEGKVDLNEFRRSVKDKDPVEFEVLGGI